VPIAVLLPRFPCDLTGISAAQVTAAPRPPSPASWPACCSSSPAHEPTLAAVRGRLRPAIDAAVVARACRALPFGDDTLPAECLTS
jgi:hypothetical protein